MVIHAMWEDCHKFKGTTLAYTSRLYPGKQNKQTNKAAAQMCVCVRVCPPTSMCACVAFQVCICVLHAHVCKNGLLCMCICVLPWVMLCLVSFHLLAVYDVI